MKQNKIEYSMEKENSVFAKKMRGLFDETKKTQKDLIEFIQKKTGKAPTRQAVSMWLHGNSPDIKTVPIIANFFGVTTDYLLTDTEIKTPKTDIIAMCNYTGLSELSLNKLHLNTLDSLFGSIDANILIEKANFNTLLIKLNFIDQLVKQIMFFDKVGCPFHGKLSGVVVDLSSYDNEENVQQVLERDLLESLTDNMPGVDQSSKKLNLDLQMVEYFASKELDNIIEDIKKRTYNKTTEDIFSNVKRNVYNKITYMREELVCYINNGEHGCDENCLIKQLEKIDFFLSQYDCDLNRKEKNDNA